jgi:FkbM family methyltransferase
MSGPEALDPPFGAHAPGPLARAARALARRTGRGGLGRVLRSALFTLAGFRRARPWDVAVFDGQRARLHGWDNLSEKRVLRSDLHWDAAERAFIAARAAAGSGVFRFADVGANAGLYTLAARAAAQAAGRPFRAVAIEPQAEMLRRLRANLAASGAGAEVAVLPWAAAAEAGDIRLAAGGANRGEARAAEAGEAGETVPARPLAEALARLDGPADVLKIDIEGHERPALAALFDAAPRADWPRAIVIEAGRGDLTLPGVALCLARGYVVAGTTRMNALLTLPD